MTASPTRLPLLLTECEAAEKLRISVDTLRRIRKRGEIAARRIGGRWRYTDEDILEYQEGQKVAAWRGRVVELERSAVTGYRSGPTQPITTPRGTTTTAAAIDRHAASRLAQTIFARPR
ncbi:helix-turn-helix domain-containing protein [Chelativorans sp. J32]|uniref:helix-turn-helix domain-containing protein n=1 Tax=Chelativorans sp. J32 TaxID=935840 RepID=UPI000A00FDA5